MGFKTFGFGGGVADVWEPDGRLLGFGGSWLGDKRYSGDRELQNPLGAVQMGLIYVNPEGPNGNPDPMAAATDIRETFTRMAMNDEETVALIAGGHTFGKTHGAGRSPMSGPIPKRRSRRAGLRLEEARSAPATAVTPSPAASKSRGRRRPRSGATTYFKNLFGYEWESDEEPAGAQQWQPKNGAGRHRAARARPASATRRRC